MYCYHLDLHVLTHAVPTRLSSDLGDFGLQLRILRREYHGDAGADESQCAAGGGERALMGGTVDATGETGGHRIAVATERSGEVAGETLADCRDRKSTRLNSSH